MTTNTLYAVPAPKFAQFHAYNCARCDHEELLHPVFLSDGNAYGTGCAAKLLGTSTRQVALDAIEAEPELRQIICDLNITRPGRITPKYVAWLTSRNVGREDRINRAIALWRAAK
jgi:hypothetical protein